MSPAAAQPAAAPPVPLLQPVRFDVEPGVVPVGRPPVRIFLGTEPAQHRAERVFFHSLLKVRDPARVYEVYRMTRLPGFAQGHWRTGFTNFRFAIPDLAGRHGRAIYNDVDEIYLADPAGLFDLPMGEAGYLALTPADTAVMLIDCARMADVWTLERAQRLGKKTLLELAADKPGLWASLPLQWHARDMEYRPGFTACLHYTALNLQPWHPTPEQYSYHPHPLGELWRDLEREADAQGYEIFSASAPSPAFADAAAQLATAPRFAAPAGLSELAGPGGSMAAIGPLDTSALGTAGVSTASLDALCGTQADLVAAARLDRCPADDLPWLIDALFAAARRAVYLAVAPSAAQEPANTEHWWRQRLRTAARRHPGRLWRLDVLDGAGQRTHGWQAVAASDTSPIVWRLHGKHAGDNAQVDAFAAALRWPGQVHRLRFSALSRLPGWLKGASRLGLTHGEPPLAPPWPDLVIAAGRRSASVARWVARQSGGRTRSVLLGRPRAPLSAFDLIVTTPQYGLPVRGNVLHLPAPPAAPTAADAGDIEHWRQRWAAQPRPWIGVLAGGDRAPYRLDADAASRLAYAAQTLATRRGGSVLATTGPRTSPAAAAALFSRLGDAAFRHRYASGESANPYRALLALADCFIVTGDSASMLAEAASTGRPVAVFDLPPRHSTARRLLNWVEKRLGLVERAAGSRGTARQQNRLGRLYDRLLAAGVISRERDVGAVQQSLGLPSLPAEPAPALLAPDLLARALGDAAARARDLLVVEQRLD
ncbi:MAG: ELM1/GtrOC1 family putative glycosyltransferase [Pseudomonadota bacterium]